MYLFLPDTCYGCRADLPMGACGPLCVHCQTHLQTPGPLICARCGKPLPDGGAHCYHCRGSKGKNFKCKIIRSAVVFGQQVRAVVHAFKYQDRGYLSGFLAERMAQEWDNYPPLSQAELLVPVPLFYRKEKQRGYNQAALLAEKLARLKNMAWDNHALKRLRNTRSQTELGREGRLQNMQGVFVCERPEAVKGKVILLIDDVATTGATLEGCATALKAAGAKKVMAYTFAREV
ncbi:ComF family protein [Candidatus Avelusimicrobium sp.]